MALTEHEQYLPPELAGPDAEEHHRASMAAIATDDPERWRIHDTRSAEFAMRMVVKYAAERREAEQQAAEWRAQIDTWLEHATAGVDRDRKFFEGQLIDYQRRRRAADPRAKSLTLPSGKVQSRETLQYVKVVQAEDFIKWAEADASRRSMVRVKKEVAVTEVKNALRIVDADGELAVIEPTTGEKVPGTAIEPRKVSFTVEAFVT